MSEGEAIHIQAGDQPVPSRRPWQRYLAEFIGTFALVFIGCGAVIVDGGVTKGNVSHVGVSLSFGLVVAAMIFALGPVSAAHFNPAVTLGFAAARRFPWKHVPAYWGSQCAGAVAGSAFHSLLLGVENSGIVSYGATIPSSTLNLGAALGIEVILTFLLMLVISAVATDRRIPGTVPGLAIGFTVVFCAMFGGPLTGASMNPARSLGPALLAGGVALSKLWIYILAPMTGSVAASCVFELMRDGSHHARSAPEDLNAALSEEPGLSRRSVCGEGEPRA